MKNTTIYAISNQKGGCGKTTLTLNLGASLARAGKKVLLIDADPQANMTMALGYSQPDELPITLPHVLNDLIQHQMKAENSELVKSKSYIMQSQGMDFIPSSIELTAIENILINTMSRENVMKKFLNYIKGDYEVVLIDTMPSLNFITINALTAADKVLIPLQPQFFSAKGLEMLLGTIANVRENINPSLQIEGALVTMFDNRINFHKEVVNSVCNAYGEHFKIFNTKIPISVRTTESQSQGISLFEHDPKGKVTQSYELFAKELIL